MRTAPLLSLIEENVWLLDAPHPNGGRVALYLVRGDRLAVIDTGFSHHVSEFLAPALGTLGLGLADVELILNTHGHPDHIGGNGTLVSASEAAVYIHPLDADLLGSVDAHLDTDQDLSHAMRRLRQDERFAARATFLHANMSPPTPPDVLVQAGGVIELGAGLDIRALAASGHTKGSVVYLLPKQRLAFAGDAIQIRGARTEALPLYFWPRHYRESVISIGDIELSRLACGHAFKGLTSVEPSLVLEGDAIPEALAESARACDEIQVAVEDAYDGWSGALEDGVNRVIKRLRPTPQPLPPTFSTVVAHIDELSNRRLRSDG